MTFGLLGNPMPLALSFLPPPMLLVLNADAAYSTIVLTE